MTIKAALLTAPPASGKGVFVRIDELADEAGLTERHLPAVQACDLPPDRYLWVPAKTDEERLRFPEGGSFVDAASLERRSRPDFDRALADLIGELETQLGLKVPETTRAWLAYAGKRYRRRNQKKGGA